jgi:hypothetical protein
MRSDAPEGKEPILRAAAARRVVHALDGAPPPARTRLLDVLQSFDGPHASTKRALFLKAIAARASSLSADGAGAQAALGVLEKFAVALRELTRAQLLVKASSLDLDGTRNTSAFDPQGLWSKRGTIGDRGGGDVDKNNDGVFQRFTAACGPATLQMALAEADPVVSFALHDALGGLVSDGTTDPIASFQRTLLEAYGGTALGRRETHLRARLRNALGRSDVDAPARAALLQHALEAGPRTSTVQRALDALRARFSGFPTDADLARMSAEKWPERDAGLDGHAILSMLHEHLTPLTGVRYRVTNPPEGLARGRAARHFDEVARVLRHGLDVPFGICEPGHWMLLSAVDGKKPLRRFLVADPDGGRTAWVTEATFASGTFASEIFHLSQGDERPFVDTFFLPT